MFTEIDNKIKQLESEINELEKHKQVKRQEMEESIKKALENSEIGKQLKKLETEKESHLTPEQEKYYKEIFIPQMEKYLNYKPNVFKDNQLVLSPVYDVINIYAVKASDKMNRLDKTQCHLSINNCNNGIKIDYFRQSCENLELDFTTIQNQLKELRDIYLEKYPQYIHNLLKSPKIKDIANFKYRLLESYKKCLKIAKSEDLNELKDSSNIKNETSSFFLNPNSSSALDSIKAEELAKSQSIKSDKSKIKETTKSHNKNKK